MGRAQSIKAQLRSYLQREDDHGLLEFSSRERSAMRNLLAMSYDKRDVLSWRAIAAIGRISRTMPVDKARDFILRVLWMMREESGNNAWTGAEIIGEILACNPGDNMDIAPIVVNFHEEPIFRAGALRAMGRISSHSPQLMHEFLDAACSYHDSPEPEVRGYALIAIDTLDPDNKILALHADDPMQFKYYDGHDLVNLKMSAIAGSNYKNARGIDQ